MNKITRINYEEYILDYVDNVLPADLNKEMDSFLNLHPDIASEVLTFRNLKVTPDPEVKFLNKESLIRKEPVKRVGLYPRLLKVAAVGLLIGCVGAYLYFDNGTEIDQTSTLVESNTVPQTEKTIIIQNKEPQTIALLDIKQGQINTEQVKVASVSTQPQNHFDHLQPVKAERSAEINTEVKPRVKRRKSNESEVNVQVYLPSVSTQHYTSNTQRRQPVNRLKDGNVTQGVEQAKSRVELSAIASIKSLPLTDQLQSITPQVDHTEQFAFSKTEETRNTILQSIIKSTPLSRISIDEIPEGLMPSFAFTEVQFIPTYIKRKNTIKQNLLKQ